MPNNLNHLHQAIRHTGLTSDINDPFAVSSRLAQTIYHTLQENHPQVAKQLVQDLHTRTDPEAYDLLLQGRGFTYFHVILYFYAFITHHANRPNTLTFPVEVGRKGGGLYINPETDVLSLTQLLVSALPQHQNDRNIGLLLQALAPMMLDKIFPCKLFQVTSQFTSDHTLDISLQYNTQNQNQTLAQLAQLGLTQEIGPFFQTIALQIQGTIQLGLRTFAQRMRDVRITPSIERQSNIIHQTLQTTCQHTWTVTWKPNVHLRRTENPDHILNQVQTIYDTLHRRDLEYFQERIKTLETRLQELEGGYHDLIGNSPQMRRVYDTVKQIADTDLTVLVRGASGSGKELVARALHNSSSRRSKPFVAVNCAAFSESLLETELFGHEKGAFTGADQTKPGRFERANGGTLFLDEAGDIPLATQIKLLRVLESREYERVGGTQMLSTDVRIVAATNRNLENLIAEGTFREDFYYRLNVLPIYLPPLRERLEDIPLLANHFLHTIAARTQAIPAKISRGALGRLLDHTYPGNVRELQHIIERAVAIYAQGGTLTADHIEQALSLGTQTSHMTTSSTLSVRQQELITLIHHSANTCTVDDLFAQSSTLSEGMGKSKRTLQNDLSKLASMGYLTWQKRGSARTYTLTPRGVEIANK